MKKIKMDSAKLISVAAGVLGLASMVVSNIKASNDQKSMKAELKEEVLKELLKDKN